MDLFDSLPGIVRRALASAAFPIHPCVAWRFLDRGLSARRVVSLIVRTDRRLGRAGGAA